MRLSVDNEPVGPDRRERSGEANGAECIGGVDDGQFASPTEGPAGAAGGSAATVGRRRGLFVAVLGADGSGKSSVIDALLRREWSSERGASRLHFRPNLGARSTDGPPVTDPHASPARGRWASCAKLLYYLLDYQLGYLWKVRPRLARGEVVIFDRYYHDLLVDGRRYRFDGPHALAGLVGRLVPAPDVSILLDADPDVLQERKREMTPEELDRITRGYRDLVDGLPGGHRVDASRPLDEVVGRVEKILRAHYAAGKRYKSFPPGLGHVRVPTSSRAAALAGINMYAPCRPLAMRLQRTAWHIVRWVGPRAIPGRARAWIPSMDEEAWSELTTRWCRELGPFDAMVIVGRQQRSRPGHMFLLLREGRAAGFVKLRWRGEASLSHEARVLEALNSYGPRSFMVPAPRVVDGLGEWSYLVTTALPPSLHRVPVDPPLTDIVAEIQAGLEELPRPPGTPAHWRPMHGDLAPWNLRQFADGLALFDWEDAGWGPPAADETLYRATAAALSGRASELRPGREAIQFWRERLARRDAPDSRDARLAYSVREALARMEPPD